MSEHTTQPQVPRPARSDLASAIAHELRTPLTSVKGLASTGARLYDSLDDAERRELFANIEAEASRLQEIIDSTATALRIEAGELDYLLGPEQLQDMVEEAVRHSPAGEHPFRVDVQLGVVVRCDRKRTVDVLRRLLDNAAKFSPPKEPVEVRAFANGEGAGVVEVIDRGPGLPAEEDGRPITMFHRVRPPGYEHVQGAGLGLYISRAHVEAQGGILRIERAEPDRTVASFTLPLEAP